MRTGEEIAKEIVDKLDTWPTPLRHYAGETPRVMQDVAAIIRAARIEAVEEFRKLALTECYDTGDGYAANRIWHRIVALPALPEGA